MSSYREKKIENFITNGGNINSKVPSMGELPIYLAIKYGYDALFYRIIEHANLDIYTHLGRGNTALQHAMIYDRAEYVQKILLYHKTSEPDTDGDIFYEQIPLHDEVTVIERFTEVQNFLRKDGVNNHTLISIYGTLIRLLFGFDL